MDIDTCESQYIDVMWLKTFGLSRHTILEYFYTSPFYDSKSNNQIIRTQGTSIDNLLLLTGIEYELDLNYIEEPHLFVIKKQKRENKFKTELLEVYYCIDGYIYKSPIFLDLVRSKFAKSSYYILNAYKAVISNTTFSADDGQKSNLNEALKTNDETMDLADNNSTENNQVKKISRTNYHFPSLNTILTDIKSM